MPKPKGKSKYSEKQMKIARVAEPRDKITGADFKAMKGYEDGGEVDLDKLPRSMKKKTRTGLFSSSYDVKESRTPKTKEERAGKTPEEKIKARTSERDRKKFEKKVQEKMGSFKDGGEVISDKEKEGRIQEKYPSKGTRTRQGMPSNLTEKDKEELSKLRPPHRDPGQLEREMKLEQEVLRRGDDEPVKTFAMGGQVGALPYRDGGMVRGCKGIQVKGKKFSGTF